MEPNQQPESPQPNKPINLKLYLIIAATVAIVALGAMCWIVPSQYHELKKSREDLATARKFEQESKTETESYKASLATMKKSRRTRTTQKVALDGVGQVVRKADGNPLVLETTLAISATDSTAASEETSMIRAEYKAKFESQERRIAELESHKDVKRGQGWSVLGAYGTRGTIGGDATGSIGILRLGVGGQTNPGDKTIEGFARGGFGW